MDIFAQDLGDKGSSILALEHHFKGGAFVTGLGFFKGRMILFGGFDIKHRHAQQLSFRVAHHVAESGVHINVVAVSICNGDALGALFGNGFKNIL